MTSGPTRTLSSILASSAVSSISAVLASSAVLGLFVACSPSGQSAARPDASGASSSIPDTATDASPDSQADDLGPCDRLGDAPSGGSLFEPVELPNIPLDGPDGALVLYSSTLQSGPAGLELYAGICHRGEHPLCSAALQLELYDHADQLLGTASGGIHTGGLYRFSQSPDPISCLAPGQTGIAVVKSFPEGLAIADLKSIGHRFPAFLLDDATLLPGATVSQVAPFQSAAGTVFRGTVKNRSDSVVADPAVSVFPLNEVGRPLGNGTGSAALEIPPGGTWEFETTPVSESGSDQIAFATARFLTPP